MLNNSAFLYLCEARRLRGGDLRLEGARFFESNTFARSSFARRLRLRPLPARLMKYVSIRRPDADPLGDTFRERKIRAILGALFVNKPFGGCVESVFT